MDHTDHHRHQQQQLEQQQRIPTSAQLMSITSPLNTNALHCYLQHHMKSLPITSSPTGTSLQTNNVCNVSSDNLQYLLQRSHQLLRLVKLELSIHPSRE